MNYKIILSLLFVSTVTTAQQSLYFSNRLDTTKYAIADTVGHGSNNYFATNTNVNFNIATLIQGYSCNVKFVSGNTGAATLTIITKAGTMTTTALKKGVSTALASGDIADGKIHHVIFDGSNFQIPSLGNSSAPADSNWHTTGNFSTNSGVNFLGTRDTANMAIRVNDSIRVLIRRGQIGLRGAGRDTMRFSIGFQGESPVYTNNAIINSMTSSLIGQAATFAEDDTLYPHGNTVFGKLAGDSLLRASALNNTLIGTAAGMSIKGFAYNANPYLIGAYENFFGGFVSGMLCDTCNGNVGVGAFTLQFGNNAANNVAVGLASQRFNYGHGNRGHSNVSVGAHSLENFLQDADANILQNVAIGGDAMNVFHNGVKNTVIGTSSALAFESGNANVVVGATSFLNATAGGNNTIIGYFAGNGCTTGNQMIRIGDLNGQFLNKTLSWSIGSGANCASATDDSSQTGLYGQNAATNEASWNKSNGQWGINDDTQGKGKVFTCEDANGYGHWNTNVDSAFSDNAVTINSPVGSFVMDSLNTTFTLTNSYITTASKIFYSKGTTGVLIDEVAIVPGSGSAVFTFEFNGVATAPNKKVTINFEVRN